MKRHILSFILLLILSWPSVSVLSTDGYFPMHDDTQVGRVIAMGRALRNGQFPVRWVSDLGYGYGYPIFNFYGPLPYYFGGMLYALGFSGLAATKFMFGAGLLLSVLTMYAFMSIWGRLAGIVGGLLYLYVPYHALDVYVRGAVGEYWAMAFLPLLFMGGFLIYRGKVKRGITIGAFGLAGVILSHTILGYITVGASVFFVLVWLCIHVFFTKFRASMLNPLILILAGLGLSSFFWLPAITEMRFTNVSGQIGGTADFRDHFVCIEQLWDSPWGFGGSAPGCEDGLSFRLGKFHILAAVAAFLLLLRIGTKAGKSGLFFSAGIVMSLFFLLPVSKPVWEALPFFSYIQYPWRFLSFAVFGLSSLIALGVGTISNIFGRSTVAVITVSAVLTLYPKLFTPQYTYAKPANSFETDDELRFTVSQISDEYLPPDVPRPDDIKDIVRDTIMGSEWLIVNPERDTETYSRFVVRAAQETKVRINRAYFPGWIYIVNGKQVTPEIDGGLPYITVPAEPTVVELHFRNTPVRITGNIISIVTLGVFILLYGKKTIS